MKSEHYLLRATIVPNIIKNIMEKYNLSEDDAIRKYYTSGVCKLLCDDDSGLYGMSELYIANMI